MKQTKDYNKKNFRILETENGVKIIINGDITYFRTNKSFSSENDKLNWIRGISKFYSKKETN